MWWLVCRPHPRNPLKFVPGAEGKLVVGVQSPSGDGHVQVGVRLQCGELTASPWVGDFSVVTLRLSWDMGCCP